MCLDTFWRFIWLSAGPFCGVHWTEWGEFWEKNLQGLELRRVDDSQHESIRTNRFARETPIFMMCERFARIASNIRNSQFLASRSAIRKKGVQFGNPGTICENQAIRANLRIDSRESCHLRFGKLSLAPEVLQNHWGSVWGFLQQVFYHAHPSAKPSCRTPKGSTEFWGEGEARTHLLRTGFFPPILCKSNVMQTGGVSQCSSQTIVVRTQGSMWLSWVLAMHCGQKCANKTTQTAPQPPPKNIEVPPIPPEYTSGNEINYGWC